MAGEDTVSTQPLRPAGEAGSPPSASASTSAAAPATKSSLPPLQPRTRTPKPLEAPPSKSQPPPEPRQPAPLAAPAARPSGLLRTSFNTSSSYSTPSMYRAASTHERDVREPPRPSPSKPELDKEELTTKGRKRKRLAKACSACHKNKRRCDGFAPCSNCEFSARPCVYLNAQGEEIPPPRTRDSSAAPMNKRGSNDDGKPAYIPAGPDRRPSGGNSSGAPGGPGGEDWGRRDYRDGDRQGNDPRDWRNGERPSSFGPLDVVDRDVALQAELIDVFLKRTHPYPSMLHVPTFLHRHYLNRVSPILLDAIYTMAARLIETESFVSAFPASVPNHLRGQTFADRCRANIDRIVEMRQHWSEEDHRLDSGTWDETEFVQSCILMSCYFNSTRQPRLGLYYLDVALSVLRPSNSGLLPPPSARLNLSTPEFHTLAEVRNRTFWMGMIQDVCSSAGGRPRRMMDHELANVPLPGYEVYWYRYGGMASGGREPGRRDSITPGTGNWHSEEGAVGEFGHIMRIMIIYSNIMAIANNAGGGSPEARHMPPSHYEQALKSWAIELPRQFRFDEVNLSAAMTKIPHALTEVAFSGWAFAYMHVVAECGMFYLQSKHAGAPFAIQRQGQAVDNLTVIIDSLGERGREGPLMFFATVIITCWTDHIRATAPSGNYQALDDRLSLWWGETYREWGWERRETLERGVFPFLDAPTPGREAPRDLRPFPGAPTLASNRTTQFEPSPSSLGLYQTSPRQNGGGESTVSPASHAVVTPSESTYSGASSSRYPVLPPLRPRASSGSFGRRSPSPGRAQRKNGSVSGPTLERERERERERGERGERSSDLHLPPLGYRKGPSSNGPLVDREYEREQHHAEHGPADKDVRSRESTNEPRPLHPPPKRERPWPTNGSGGPLLGIDALVSAAEEHRRESLAETSASA